MTMLKRKKKGPRLQCITADTHRDQARIVELFYQLVQLKKSDRSCPHYHQPPLCQFSSPLVIILLCPVYIYHVVYIIIALFKNSTKHEFKPLKLSKSTFLVQRLSFLETEYYSKLPQLRSPSVVVISTLFVSF